MIITVTVCRDNEEYTAEAEGPDIKGNRLRLAAKATVDALERCLGIGSRFAVNEIQLVSLGGYEVVLLSISVDALAQEETLLGTALVKGDPLDSAVRATLDAVNRRLGMLNHV